MQQGRLRREVLGMGLRAVCVTGGLGVATPAGGAPVWNPGLAKEIEKAFRAVLGVRRGGMALVELEGDRPVMALSPSSSRDRILPAHQILWRPGSTVKPFLMEVLANKKVCGDASEYACQGRLRVGDRILDCSHATQPGPLTAAEALACSCNEYFAHFARRLPVDTFSVVLRNAGFADRQPLAMAGAPAEVSAVAHPEQHLLQCLGESHVLTTPLALLGAYQRLLQRMEAQASTVASRILREGMRGCVEEGTGVAAQVPGLEIAGKTGTGSARNRTHVNGWFVSYAPAASPRLVMVTFVEDGSGGQDAAPLAGAVWRVLGERRVLG